jgi:hypothetical protein
MDVGSCAYLDWSQNKFSRSLCGWQQTLTAGCQGHMIFLVVISSKADLQAQKKTMGNHQLYKWENSKHIVFLFFLIHCRAINDSFNIKDMKIKKQLKKLM